MEEDIKNLTEIINLCNEELNNKDENVTAILDLTDLLSLRNLLKRIQELKEIEQSHRQENGELRKQVKELEERNINLIQEKMINDNSVEPLPNFYDYYDVIPVSLVKEKIEEINKVDENLMYKHNIIRVLEELLEKRK